MRIAEGRKNGEKEENLTLQIVDLGMWILIFGHMDRIAIFLKAGSRMWFFYPDPKSTIYMFKESNYEKR